MSKNTTSPGSEMMKETFVGDAIVPSDSSFSVSAMATGQPGLPGVFSWKRRKYSVLEILEEWKETGDCRHGSGELFAVGPGVDVWRSREAPIANRRYGRLQTCATWMGFRGFQAAR